MKLLFVADAGSPTAQNWISGFVETGHSVHLVSTYPADPLPGLASFEVIPVAFSSIGGSSSGSTGKFLRTLAGARIRTAIRQRIGALTLSRSANRLTQKILSIEPDLVHALRIPFEGMLAAQAVQRTESMAMRKPRLAISIWGNDFTLHAISNPQMGKRTTAALKQSDAVLADCRRDIRLAHEWGFPDSRPSLVVPGGGGIRLDIFHPADLPSTQPMTIIQPRGVRAYVENDAFFKAIPIVLNRHPGTRFLCPAMAGEQSIIELVSKLGIGKSVDLLPKQSQSEMADLFRLAEVVVSPTSHDGTPNSLLEALACGCFPVAGNLESIREWITDGENGLLVDSKDPRSIASALIKAMEDQALRSRAKTHNLERIKAHADRDQMTEIIGNFYRNL